MTLKPQIKWHALLTFPMSDMSPMNGLHAWELWTRFISNGAHIRAHFPHLFPNFLSVQFDRILSRPTPQVSTLKSLAALVAPA